MSNFTPGPWEKKGNTIFGNGRRICDLLILYDGDWQPWAEEQEANAHLIAAAPELYETLKELINRLYHNAMAFHELPELMQNELINKGRRALAKVEKGE